MNLNCFALPEHTEYLTRFQILQILTEIISFRVLLFLCFFLLKIIFFQLHKLLIIRIVVPMKVLFLNAGYFGQLQDLASTLCAASLR